MNLTEIEQHWKNWATTYKQDLKATTKTSTIKKLEVDALARSIKTITHNKPLNILEVGCGNGFNCFLLSQHFPDHNFTGVDFIPEMVEHALATKEADYPESKVSFLQANVLELESHKGILDHYDIIYTDRCLINLNTSELQENALKQLSHKLKDKGHLILIENIEQTYNQQNQLRQMADLAPRKPADFNKFIDENSYLKFAEQRLGLNLLKTEDFASLHDMLLYILIPMINDGNVNYDHPLMEAVTKLQLANNNNFDTSFGPYGQNRLYHLQKT
ncbi:MAG: class I SAM-dependent methyltransferase [Planctomycetes bacterium]|nr:class I SAM-dependent methyltransferase [Planctomycetota bacterium]